ncbi:MAG: hypothetical protein J0H14_19000 [Alphaproteobacteria bacterium]|nr:hypothetical protein [Alphaproteobacteria bacterium]
MDPFDPERLEEAKYIMSIGSEVYLSSEEGGGKIIPLAEDEAFQIAPGQFAFIITREIVQMPFDAIGFISINAKVKFWGLVNISGFHVDPGYHGRLLFSVSNAGPGPVHLRRGQAIFPLWLAGLDRPIGRATPKSGYMNIDTSLITSIAGSYTSVYQLSDIVRRLRNEYDATKTEIATLRATRTHLTVLLAIVSVLFGGVVTASLRYVGEYIIAPLTITRSAARPAPALPPPAAIPTPQPQLPAPAQPPAKRQG